MNTRQTVLAMVMGLVLAGAVFTAQGATGIPVPLPEAPAVPSGEDLRVERQNLEGFMSQADQYIRAVHDTTSKYRKYVANVKEQMAGCKVHSDLQAPESHPFASLINRGGVHCRSWMQGFNEVARAQARSLNEAQAFQREVLEAAESVQSQLQQIALYERALQIKTEVERGFQAIEDAKSGLKPWMEQR